MPLVFLFLVLALFLIAIGVRAGRTFYFQHKADVFWREHFEEERLYTLEEVAQKFQLPQEHFHKLIGVLEESGHFKAFTDYGVTMRKRLYSSFELRTLARVVVSTRRLSV